MTGPGAAKGAGERPPARPRFLPDARWARWTLALLVVFTVLRGGMWAMTQPLFWAPDEDYHFLYVEHLATQYAIPSPDGPLYPREYALVTAAMEYDSYASGPRTDFTGDPKASVGRLEGLPDSDREPREVGRGVNVVHAPLYYVGGSIVNAALGDASPFTRIAAVRWMSAVLGGLVVFLAWLLAAQVFRREWLQLTAAVLVALQPMIGFLSGIVSNDIAVTAGFTGALALMLFQVRTPPLAAQGLWVGGAVAVALLAKSTALALLPLAALAYGGQALVWPDRRGEVLRSAAIALGVVTALAGWWYVRSAVMYGSVTGAASAVVPSGPGEAASIGDVPGLVWDWTRLTYRTYWWHFYAREAPSAFAGLVIPFAIGVGGVLGLAFAVVRKRKALVARHDPLLRQVLLMGAAILVLYLPPLTADVLRGLNGDGFILVAGRFLLPAYPAAAVLLLVGVRELVPGRLMPWTCGALIAAAAAFCWTVWVNTYVHRYFGEASWQELFRRMSFDRPEFVTPVTYTVAAVALIGCLAAALTVMVVAGTRQTGTARRPAPLRTTVGRAP